MKLNMGIVDRCIRVCLVVPGLVLSSWIVFGFGSVVGVLFLVVAGIMLVTSAVGFCPTYTLFGIDTNRAARTAEPADRVDLLSGLSGQSEAPRPAAAKDKVEQPKRQEQLTHSA